MFTSEPSVSELEPVSFRAPGLVRTRFSIKNLKKKNALGLYRTRFSLKGLNLRSSPSGITTIFSPKIPSQSPGVWRRPSSLSVRRRGQKSLP